MTQQTKLLDGRFFTAAEIMDRLKISKSTFYARLKNGDLPAPVKIGPRCSRWPESAFEDFLQISVAKRPKKP